MCRPLCSSVPCRACLATLWVVFLWFLDWGKGVRLPAGSSGSSSERACVAEGLLVGGSRPPSAVQSAGPAAWSPLCWQRPGHCCVRRRVSDRGRRGRGHVHTWSRSALLDSLHCGGWSALGSSGLPRGTLDWARVRRRARRLETGGYQVYRGYIPKGLETIETLEG